MQGLKALGGVAAGHGEERSGAEKWSGEGLYLFVLYTVLAGNLRRIGRGFR